MRVIISGAVTDDDIDTAGLLAGIVPTSFVTNGRSTPPFSVLETVVLPVDKMLGIAETYGLLVYQARSPTSKTTTWDRRSAIS